MSSTVIEIWEGGLTRISDLVLVRPDQVVLPMLTVLFFREVSGSVFPNPERFTNDRLGPTFPLLVYTSVVTRVTGLVTVRARPVHSQTEVQPLGE